MKAYEFYIAQNIFCLFVLFFLSAPGLGPLWPTTQTGCSTQIWKMLAKTWSLMMGAEQLSSCNSKKKKEEEETEMCVFFLAIHCL